MKKNDLLIGLLIILAIFIIVCLAITFTKKESITITYSEEQNRLSQTDENKIKEVIISHYFSDTFGGENCKEDNIAVNLHISEVYNESCLVGIFGCHEGQSIYELKKEQGEWKIVKVDYLVV